MEFLTCGYKICLILSKKINALQVNCCILSKHILQIPEFWVFKVNLLFQKSSVLKSSYILRRSQNLAMFPLSTVITDKSKVEISQNFAAFSEYMSFTSGKHFLIIFLGRILQKSCFANFKFGGTLFSKITPNFCSPNAMSTHKMQ